MLVSVISLLITVISTHEISDVRRWRLVPTARGARNLDSLTSISLHSHEEMVVPKMRRPHSSTRTHRNREEQEEDDIEDITRFENQIRRRVKRIGRKGRRTDERPLDRDQNPQKPNELEATTEDPSLPIHPVHRLQSKRKHFVIVAPTPPDATPEPIIQLSNQTNPEKPGENNQRSGTEFKRDTDTVQTPPSGLRVETDQTGATQLEINPENLPDEYRRLLAKGYRSYPVFNSKNYKKPAQPLFEANLVPQIDAAQNLPQNLQNRFSFPTNQFPPAFQQSQQPPGVQILPGAQGGSFLVPQGLGGGQNVNLALLARARQLLALREYELIKAKQELMLQQARQVQLQQQFAQNQNRLGRAINGQPAQLANGQIDPLLLAELHNRQLFTAQLMAQAQQRAYHPEAALIPGNQQRFVIPQNLAPPPQLGGQQFGSAYLTPLTENDQSQFNFSPGGNLGPTATFLSNGRQLEIPVVFKRAAQRNPQ